MSNVTPKTGTISLAALQAGDRAEFSRLVENTSDMLYRLALRMLGSPQDAEDVVQETYLKALRSLPKFEGRSSLNTWLYRIAMNEVLMMLRKRKPEAFFIEDKEENDDEGFSKPYQIVDWCCLPEKELLSEETRKFIDAAIERLPPKLRSVLLMRDIEKMSIQQTAEALELSESAVKTRLLRARLKMREELSEYFADKIDPELSMKDEQAI